MSAQNFCGSFTERSYIARYLALSQWLPATHCGSTGITSAIAPSVPFTLARRRPLTIATCTAYSHEGSRADNVLRTFCRNGRGPGRAVRRSCTDSFHRLAHTLGVFPALSTDCG